MREARFYLAGIALAFGGLVWLILAGPSWQGAALLLAGLGAVAVGTWLRGRRSEGVVISFEDDHLHPIPVLDAPKGTYDLITGMAVQVENRLSEPVGVRIDTLLYERTPWKWDRPVSEAPAVALLAPSVVPGQSTKSFFVRNCTRIPGEIDALTRSHFVKLLIETSGYGKSIHRVFLRERFELIKESPRPAPADPAWDRAPLLPFSEGLESNLPRRRGRSLGARIRRGLRKLRIGSGEPTGEFEIHRLRRSDDSLEGLIDEINAELEDDRKSGTPAARGGGSSSSRGR